MVKSSSGESLPAGALNTSHPYKMPQPLVTLLKYDADFPLRKTGIIYCVFLPITIQLINICSYLASEPNLLKMRLKQSVIERKTRINGPVSLRRHERLLQTAQRRQQKPHNNSLAASMFAYIHNRNILYSFIIILL